MRIIGAASEFWRLRVMRVDTTNDLDFEWHEDILYRAPLVTPAREVELWYVEAIRIDDLDTVVRIGSFCDRDEADGFFRSARDDLLAMTKTQFEDAYLTPSPSMEPDVPEDQDLL